MDDHVIATLVLAECPLYVQVTELVHGELSVRKPTHARTLKRFRYHEWIEDAETKGWESLDVYVKYGGDYLWVGEILDGLGVAPFLRSPDAMREFAYEWDPFDNWDGFCTECKDLCGRLYAMAEISAGVWECAECGAVEYHACPPSAHSSKVQDILEDLLENGLPQYQVHILSCMEAR